MAKVLLPHIQDLITHYQTAQAKLIDIIARQQARGNIVDYRKAVLANVNAELDVLNKYVIEWTSRYLPMSYESGAESSYAAFRKAGIDIGVVAINTNVVEDIVFQAKEQFVTANAYIGRRIDDVFREVGMSVINDKVATGSMVKQAKKDMLKRFESQGVTTITYRNGRIVQMDVYAGLVARTTTAEAANKGAMNAVTDLGYDLVKMSQQNTSCPVCVQFEGRVYSISGNDPNYPPLSTAFYRGYNTIHVNCSHRVSPYFPQYDDNADKVREDSMRPFTVPEDKKASIARYNEQQQVNVKRARDRNQWLKAKTLAPDVTPQTFSAFRSMKRADSPKYKAIKAKVKEANK